MRRHHQVIDPEWIWVDLRPPPHGAPSLRGRAPHTMRRPQEDGSSGSDAEEDIDVGLESVYPGSV